MTRPAGLGTLAIVITTITITMTMSLGCSSPAHKRALRAPDAAVAAGGSVFRRCLSLPFKPLPTRSFRHVRSKLLVRMGAADHVAADALANTEARPRVSAKIRYGTMSKDLEDEPVALLVDDCQSIRPMGELLTDDDGRVSFDLPEPLPPGVYALYFQVLGDGSGARSFLWVLPRGTHIVVSDIDGTMTVSDGEMLKDVQADLLSFVGKQGYNAKAYPGAQALVAAHVELGHVVVYLTGRPYWLAGYTRRWLSDNGFPVGPLVLTESNSQAVPRESGVGQFKLQRLRALLASGMLIDFAYGNAATDVWAFGNSGIPAAQTYIIGEHGGSAGTHEVHDSWQARVDEVVALPAVAQPFSW